MLVGVHGRKLATELERELATEIKQINIYCENIGAKN